MMLDRWDKMNAAHKPSMKELSASVQSRLWDELCGYIEKEYDVKPLAEFSRCAVPGWNVKYRKSGRALCTLYPGEGEFTVLVVIGEREKPEMELLLPSCTEYVRQVYRETKEGMGQRWLMIDVKEDAVLADVKRCISIRRNAGLHRKKKEG